MAGVKEPQPIARCPPATAGKKTQRGRRPFVWKGTARRDPSRKKILRPGQPKESTFKSAESDQFQIGPRTVAKADSILLKKPRSLDSNPKKWRRSGEGPFWRHPWNFRKCLIPNELPRMDSNHDKVIQSHLCYRYTTRQLCGRIE